VSNLSTLCEVSIQFDFKFNLEVMHLTCKTLKNIVSMNCRSTEGSHVKTNLVHTLYRVQKYGLLPIERFNEMLRPSELKRCWAPKTKKTWYSMPLEVFTTFLFRVRDYLIKFTLIYFAFYLNNVILLYFDIELEMLILFYSDFFLASNLNFLFLLDWAARDSPSNGCCTSKVQ
jgi:hypothetical protein